MYNLYNHFCRVIEHMASINGVGLGGNCIFLCLCVSLKDLGVEDARFICQIKDAYTKEGPEHAVHV